MKLKDLIIPTIVVIVALVILQQIQPMILQVADYPEWASPIVGAIKHFFKVTPFAVALSYAWALLGYLRYTLGKEEVTFQAQRLFETFLWFEGLIYTIGTGLSPEVASSVSAIIMAVKAVFSKILGK